MAVNATGGYNSNMAFDLAQFKLQKVVLEIRYDQAFLLWDNAGTIWFTLRRNFPGARLKTVQPNQQIVTLDKALQAATQLDRSFLDEVYPSEDLENFRAAADIYFSCVIPHLDLTDLSRVGLRLIYEKNFETRVQASEFILMCKPSLQRTGKHFNVENPQVLDPEIFVRWEGDALGCSVKLYSIEQRLDVDFPPDFPEAKAVNVIRNSAILDVDYYTHASLSVSKFNAAALIDNWRRIVRRDVGRFIDG